MKYKNITKGRGDFGETDLLFGMKVSKSDSIIKLLGVIDEFNATLGLCIAHQVHLKDRLVQIQNQLIDLMGYIAAIPSEEIKAVTYRARGRENMQTYMDILDSILEETAKVLDSRTGGQKGWANYGTTGPTSAFLDLATTVCRRCELELVDFLSTTSKVDAEKGDPLIKYFNRLSKVLYLYARLEAQ